MGELSSKAETENKARCGRCGNDTFEIKEKEIYKNNVTWSGIFLSIKKMKGAN